MNTYKPCDYEVARQAMSGILLIKELLASAGITPAQRSRAKERMAELKREYRTLLKKANEAPSAEVISTNDFDYPIVVREWVGPRPNLDEWTARDRKDYLASLLKAGEPHVSPSGREFIVWNALVRFPERGWAYYECLDIDV